MNWCWWDCGDRLTYSQGKREEFIVACVGVAAIFLIQSAWQRWGSDRFWQWRLDRRWESCTERSMMTLGLPRDWPPCGAANHDSRRARTRCRARGDGWGQRCRHHGGLVIPEGPHAIVVAPAGIYCWRTLKGALHPAEGARQRVSWRIAVLLVETGTVDRGFFFGRKGSSLLRQLRAGNLDVRPIGGGARTALGLTQYAFRRKAAA